MKQNIKAILCDLDDTLLETGVLFKEHMDLFSEVCSKDLGAEYSNFRKELQLANDATFAKFGVRRSKWQIVAANLIEIYGDGAEETFSRHYHILDDIYKRVPKLKPGAAQFLLDVQRSEIPFSLLTHANEPWTILKMDGHQLWRYTDKLHIIPEREHKTRLSWSDACDAANVLPSEALAIGDSIVSDIVPAFEAGILNLAWIKNVNPWSIYVNKELPKGVIVLESVSEVFLKVLEL